MYLQSCWKMTPGIFSTTLGLNFQRRKSTRGSIFNVEKWTPGQFSTRFKILRYTGCTLRNSANKSSSWIGCRGKLVSCRCKLLSCRGKLLSRHGKICKLQRQVTKSPRQDIKLPGQVTKSPRQDTKSPRQDTISPWRDIYLGLNSCNSYRNS
jgi:hypothetical protein